MMSLQLALGQATHPTIANAAATSSLEVQIDTLAKQYNVSAALAQRIIKCESQDNPKAVRVNAHSKDLGLWQINNRIWQAILLKKGFDITIPSQNLEAGFYLLKTYGSSLWNWSSYCWKK